MLGPLGQLGPLLNLLKNPAKLKEDMRQMNERLDAARFAGESGAGQVTATVNGRGNLVGVKIDPELLRADDLEMLEDLIVAAVRDGVSKSRETMQKEMQSMAGGIDLSGMSHMLGG